MKLPYAVGKFITFLLRNTLFKHEKAVPDKGSFNLNSPVVLVRLLFFIGKRVAYPLFDFPSLATHQELVECTARHFGLDLF